MAEDRIEWTDQQKQAIDARGSDVLVTASAGTGKTAVLSGRCVDLVADQRICPDVRNMLVLTFTEMAAEQMRSRIAERLGDEFGRTGEKRLRRQLVLLPGADISTIHSFCKRLISQYFHDLALDPTFSVIDADEARLLKAEILERAVDSIWRQDNAEILAQFLRRRDIRAGGGFLNRVIQLSDFLDGVVRRDDWCEKTLRLARLTDPGAGELGVKQKSLIKAKLCGIVERLSSAMALYDRQTPGGEWGDWFKANFIRPVAECLAHAQAEQWDKCAESITNFTKPRFKKPKEVPKSLAELIHKSEKEAFKTFGKLSSLAVLNPDYAEKVGGPVGMQTQVLIELVRKFDQLYSQAKLALNCLDFADLEHYALRLLTGQAEAGGSRPSVAGVLRERYKYIFVDEYQDINPVQQAILDEISNGDNLFVVGDVKQSIYAWRGAEPQIFLDRLKAPDAAGGYRVDLNANFRSAAGILDFVNRLFSRIMTASFAGIDYDESAHLRPASTGESAPASKDRAGPIVEFHILDDKAADDNDNDEQADESDEGQSPDIITSRRRQAALVARRIRRMVGAETGKAEFQIYDKEQRRLRDVTYSDIVILMRSLVGSAKDYVEVLRLAGVPVSCEAAAGYFEATEITDMLCLLKVLDNPQRDIELAAVLRSPFFGVGDSELAAIRLHGAGRQDRAGFYDCLVEYSQSGPDGDLAARLVKILRQIEQWRTAARQGSIADMIWRIYRSTDYLAFVSALPIGQARRANLLKLHDRAIQFEGFLASTPVASLRRFVEFIEKLQEAGQDWAPAEPAASAENAVRILSVHKSKGLEFPVVFLTELQAKFNTRDVNSDCLADAEDTLGIRIIDTASKSQLSSLAHQVIAERKRAVLFAEEMRILYVATTRARERLVLTGSKRGEKCAEIITGGLGFKDRHVPDWLLAGCNNPLDWILQAFSDRSRLHEAFETGLADKCQDDNLFTFAFHSREELRELSEFVTNLKTAKSKPRKTQHVKASGRRTIINNQLSTIKESLAWRYDFAEAPLLPAKTSVSELTHRGDEFAKADFSSALDRRPACLAGRSNEAAAGGALLVGSASHLVIAGLDLSERPTSESIGRTVELLVSTGAITPAVAEQVDTASILAFFETDVGRLALDPANKVHREWPFTFALPACELPAATTDDASRSTPERIRDTVVVQGIIDMLIETPAELVVVDFKTDRVSAAQVCDRAELYRSQLNAYAKAAAAILKAPPPAKYLYFLAPRVVFELR
ncbi:MAG: helicase-exonuclease AddAB subunit AddA [Sedimentisphaerales bacterium]|nr:helicase-exonuclease AddAB subunit AddA [Sedimentisphaerales bacterium]